MHAKALTAAVAIGLLAVPAVPAVAASPSCVGQFSSDFATQYGAVFGAEMSDGAHEPDFGPRVAWYAHETRDGC
jgi:hypothetical protein